jgi:hypothetical protein
MDDREFAKRTAFFTAAGVCAAAALIVAVSLAVALVSLHLWGGIFYAFALYGWSRSARQAWRRAMGKHGKPTARPPFSVLHCRDCGLLATWHGPDIGRDRTTLALAEQHHGHDYTHVEVGPLRYAKARYAGSLILRGLVRP